MKRNLYVGAIFLALLGVLAAASIVLQKQAAVEAAGVMVRESGDFLHRDAMKRPALSH